MSTKLTPNNIRVKIKGNSCVKTTLAAPSTTTSSTASSCAKKGAGISNYSNRLSVNAEVVCDLPTAPIITSNGGENNITTNNHYATTASNGGEKNVCLWQYPTAVERLIWPRLVFVILFIKNTYCCYLRREKSFQ